MIRIKQKSLVFIMLSLFVMSQMMGTNAAFTGGGGGSSTTTVSIDLTQGSGSIYKAGLGNAWISQSTSSEQIRSEAQAIGFGTGIGTSKLKGDFTAPKSTTYTIKSNVRVVAFLMAWAGLTEARLTIDLYITKGSVTYLHEQIYNTHAGGWQGYGAGLPDYDFLDTTVQSNDGVYLSSGHTYTIEFVVQTTATSILGLTAHADALGNGRYTDVTLLTATYA